MEVKMGHRVVYPILRQIDIKEAESIEVVEESMDVTMMSTGFPLILFIGIGGRLLPTWMFLNSL